MKCQQRARPVVIFLNCVVLSAPAMAQTEPTPAQPPAIHVMARANDSDPAATLEPTSAIAPDDDAVRESIHGELDANQKSVQELYQVLDATHESDQDRRAFLENQISQIDDRNTVLFDQLEQLDRNQYERDRQNELKEQAESLAQQASELRQSGHKVEAAAREAKATVLQEALQDGSWKVLIANEWSCEPPATPLVAELRQEVDQLRSETVELRAEVTELRRLLQYFLLSRHPAKRDVPKIESK